MDSFLRDKFVKEELIDWNTPPMSKNNTNNEICINNNPFDAMELKAFTMDPFDLVFNETPRRKEPPCANILSPLWELNFRPLRKSMSLTDISGVAKNLEKVSKEQSNNDCTTNKTTLVCVDDGVDDKSKENCDPVQIEENKEIENQDHKSESIITIDQNNEISVEKQSLCNEDEKKQIREETRRRIQMLIEKREKKYEEECSRKSLFCTPSRSSNSTISTDGLFNRGFIQSASYSISSNSSSNKSSSKIHENNASNNDYGSNDSLEFHMSELNSFDLNSLKPEWVIDNFSDSDGSMEVQIKDKSEATGLNNNNEIDIKLKALNRIGIIETNQTGCHILKSTHIKKPQNKGPFLANVPVQHMVQDYKEENIHAPNSPRGQIKPVASSTPTVDIVAACKTPSTTESSIKPNLSRQSVRSSIGSPSTPLNVTKCLVKTPTYDVGGKKVALPSASHQVSSANKRSNTTIVLYGGTHERNTEKIEAFKLNKSKSLSKIGKIPKPMEVNTNRLSGLPVPKRLSMAFKGKENAKPQ